MLPDHITPEQKQVLAEIGHFHLMLESHQRAAQHCAEQIQSLRSQLETTEQERLQG